MARDDLILDRYEPLGTAGTGGFGTVTIAWDPRIQRKVAIKAIKLTAHDAQRAALPGAQAVQAATQPQTADRWHGVLPWEDYVEQSARRDADGASNDGDARDAESVRDKGGPEADLSQGRDQAALRHAVDEAAGQGPGGAAGNAGVPAEDAPAQAAQVKTLAHIPGLDEARTAAMLADPRIVTVYDFEVRGRMAYLIMEYVEGLTLTRILADYPDYLTLPMVAAVFSSVAGALTAAHEAGVLHLDIKPDNILVNRAGQVKVTDFGLATLADASGAGTTGGGTIGYMPLEQMRREHLDARADEWALASVAYEMLTGANPFRVRGLEKAEAAIQDAELVLPSLCWENLDEQADDVIFYALDPDRDERYSSVADFAEELEKFLGDAERGSEQLSLVVCDAIDPLPEEGGESAEDEEYGYWDEAGYAGDAMPSISSWLSRRSGKIGQIGRVLATAVAADEQDEGRAEGDGSDGAWVDEDADGPEDGRASRSPLRGMREGGASLLRRVDERAFRVIGRLLAAAAGALVVCLALSNVQMLAAGLGDAAVYVVAGCAVAAGVLSAVRADVGAFVAYSLLSIAVILCGHPVLGTVLLVANVAWWYAVGSADRAQGCVALLVALLGAVGGAGAAPLFAGAVSRPLRAGLTAAYGALVAFVLAAMGTRSLLGWDAFACWSFARVDMTANVLAMVQGPDVWTTAAGWVTGALCLAGCVSQQSRFTAGLGVVVACACVIAGGLAFSVPSPQLFVAPVLGGVIAIASGAVRQA